MQPSPSTKSEKEIGSVGLSELIELLRSSCYRPNRNSQGTFIFSVDHCFSIRGHGTVMTGTVISGSVAINDVRLCVVQSLIYVLQCADSSDIEPAVTVIWHP